MYKITGMIYARIKSNWTKNPENLTDLENEMILRTEQSLNGEIAKELYHKYGLAIRVHFTDIEIMGRRAKIGGLERNHKKAPGRVFGKQPGSTDMRKGRSRGK